MYFGKILLLVATMSATLSQSSKNPKPIIQLAETPNWTVESCIYGKSFSFTNSGNSNDNVSSSLGIWFVEPVKIDRACFNVGVWAIYKEWCESPVIWTVGTSRKKSKMCMDENLLKSVAGIVYLGKEESGGAVFTSHQKLTLGTVESTNLYWNLLDPEINVVHWGNNASYELNQRELTGATTTASRDNSHKSCLFQGQKHFQQHRLKASITQNVAFELYPSDCSNAKVMTRQKSSLPLPQTQSDFKLEHATIHVLSNKNSLTCWDLRERFYNMKNKTHRSPIDIALDVDTQSKKVGLQYQSHYFHTYALAELNLQEWDVLEASKTLLQTICPDPIVPKFFMDSMLILINYLLADSALNFPRSPSLDSFTFNRVLESVQRCMESAKPIHFTTIGCSSDALIQFRYRNGTTNALDQIQLPRDIRNDLQVYDLIVEVMWKLTLFTHYTCAPEFGNFSSDFSMFYSMMQDLITEDLQERWLNPGNSFKMMKMIFKKDELERGIMNLDKCVALAQITSAYKGWMKRPFQDKFMSKQIPRKDLIWEGVAYKMDSFAFPAIHLGYPIKKCGVSFQDEDSS